ncbi:MAG TPA: peptidoglycan endopeptidase [Candidatus Omnitrophota bacterium]|nr:peptidoglycan endopeptidase [Candidatus Omnitrophota bacterium]
MQNVVKIVGLSVLILSGCMGTSFSEENIVRAAGKYAVAISPVPVLNTADFCSVFGGDDGTKLKTDESGLIREIEFIAFSRTVFTIDEVIVRGENTVYKVTTLEYPASPDKCYYVDSRFVEVIAKYPSERVKRLPDKADVIRGLLSAEGVAYVWGGNQRKGIPEMLLFYPPRGRIDLDVRKKWMLQGVDCSGLLYEATRGYTPRNTGDLVKYGIPVDIEGKGVNDIIAAVEPLDLIVWAGHVIIILDKDRIIQSRQHYEKDPSRDQGGVRISSLRDALRDLVQERRPVNDYEKNEYKPDNKFVIRRWYGVDKGEK